MDRRRGSGIRSAIRVGLSWLRTRRRIQSVIVALEDRRNREARRGGFTESHKGRNSRRLSQRLDLRDQDRVLLLRLRKPLPEDCSRHRSSRRDSLYRRLFGAHRRTLMLQAH
jgi:hypothetical protein